MEILKIVSLFYSLVHILIMFMMLCDLRFDRKKKIIIAVSAMLPLILLNSVLIIVLGKDVMSKFIFLTLSVPSLIFFLFMTKKIDGRFFFTFCFTDTIGFEIISLSAILDCFLGNDQGVLLFVVRLIAFPLTELLLWKYFRKSYFEVQSSAKKGWWLCAALAGLFYILLAVEISVPTYVTSRHDDIPALLLSFIIMPLTYIALFRTLLAQKQSYEAEEYKRNSEKQIDILRDEMLVARDYVAKAKASRHDMRHVINVAVEAIRDGHGEDAVRFLSDYDASISAGALKTYCENDMMNAVFRVYDRRCVQDNIKYEVSACIPKDLPYSDIETATLFGNLLENAYEAAKKGSESFICVDARIKNGNLVCEIKNSVFENTVFQNGLPATTKSGGGIGSKSALDITAKHGGILRMEQKDNIFITQLAQRL